MSGVKQLETVQRVRQSEERRRAQELAARERRVAECETKLAELERYEQGYVGDFARGVRHGMNGARLREYQAFLARLGEARRQQIDILARARAERDAELASWRHAAQQAEMLEHIVRRKHDEARREQDRREQHESDELSARSKHG